MGPPSSQAGFRLAGRRPPLPIESLADHFPSITNPLAQNESVRHMRTQERRGNARALRASLLRSYLATM